MEDIILAFLGPYTKLVLGLSLAAVVIKRKSIRKRHIVTLLILTVLAFIAFFALLLWSFTWYKGQKSVVVLQVALRILAAGVVGCGSAIGFSFILKSLGLASLEDTDSHVPIRRGR